MIELFSLNINRVGCFGIQIIKLYIFFNICLGFVLGYTSNGCKYWG